MLATGGLGRVFLNTTNPDVATGDGVAMAYRAGAEIADIEFVQFHPTALAVAGAPRFLLSEALRGEGALLRQHARRAFHGALPPAEGTRAARRGGARHRQRDDAAPARRTSFSISPIAGESFIRERFPRIYETCLQYGVNIGIEAAPVAPAAHYAMGGVSTDLDGRTSVPRLFAAGEAACTGVHGANRLASNSLLEGVVFGIRAGRAMRETAASAPAEFAAPAAATAYDGGLADEIQRIAWEDCGIVRSAEGLARACARLESLAPSSPEERNMRQVALLIARCASARKESRGAHFRIDYPQKRRGFRKAFGGESRHRRCISIGCLHTGVGLK